MASRGRIPQQFIDDLLARVDLVELINARVPLRKRGHTYLACCPFHNEKTPSFTVSPIKQFYHCFGCGANGNAISFLMNYEHQEFPQAIETLAGEVGMEVPHEQGNAAKIDEQNELFEVLKKTASFFQKQLREHPQASLAIGYLKKRGLTGTLAKELMIGFAPESWDSLLNYLKPTDQNLSLKAGVLTKNDKNRYYDRFRNRIIFPIRDQRGRVIAFGGRVLDNGEPKYLNSPETPVFHKGRELYGLYEVLQQSRKPDSVVIVEGYMDVAGLRQHNISNVVATLGTATTADHLKRLFRYTSTVIFCFDGDRAGQKAAWRALETSLPLMYDGRTAQFMFLPDGEDPDSLVKTQGEEAFVKLMKSSTPLPDFFFANLQKNHDLTRLDERAAFAKKTAPFLDKLPAGLLQHMMFTRLAQLVSMDEQALTRLITSSKTHYVFETTAKSLSKNRSLMRHSIILLLHNPSIASEITLPETVRNLTVPGIDFFLMLFDYLTEHPQANIGTLLENWRGQPEEKIIAKLATLEHHAPSDGAKTELLDALARLEKQQLTQTLDTLIAKAKVTPLTTEEKQHLQQLIHAKQSR